MKKTFTFCFALCVFAVLGGLSTVFAQAKTYTNDIGMEFVLVPAGSFYMGSPGSEEGRDGNEVRHKVTISKPFYMGKYEVTQAQWMAIMGSNPSGDSGWDRPVENVSWEDTQVFIKKLNQREGTNQYRLPTEVEWEYAARAGSTTAYCFGDDASQLEDYAWYSKNSGGKTRPVGERRPNKWGLYDMHGNVWEWVQDWYADWYYGASPPVDPKGPKDGDLRVLRGCCCFTDARDCRSALRSSFKPAYSTNLLGLRLAFSPEQ